MLALHLAVKILLQIFLYEDLSTLMPHTSVGYISSGPHFVTQPILLSENIPNIWHKSSTKHKGGQTNWNDKNDNARSYAPSYHMEGLPMAQVAILKKYWSRYEKDLDCELFILN